MAWTTKSGQPLRPREPFVCLILSFDFMAKVVSIAGVQGLIKIYIKNAKQIRESNQ